MLFVFKCLLVILVPIALVGLGVRLLLTPQYLRLEYALPNFPADEYGFSMDERVYWGAYGINYLLIDAPVSYLGDLKFSSGQALFTERELDHMQDVKRVVRYALPVWYLAIVTMVGFGFWARHAGRLSTFRQALRLGGWLTIGIAGTAGLIGTLGASGSGMLFWQFFSGFHGLFFSGDSWLFSYSDTLIRLYPLRFWQDSILYTGVLAALGAAALAFGLRERPAA
jgi:integral membrane protein (TIGR01906 family)